MPPLGHNVFTAIVQIFFSQRHISLGNVILFPFKFHLCHESKILYMSCQTCRMKTSGKVSERVIKTMALLKNCTKNISLYIEICVLYWKLKIWELLDLKAPKVFLKWSSGLDEFHITTDENTWRIQKHFVLWQISIDCVSMSWCQHVCWSN